MNCPVCNHAESRILETRGNGQRRRQCEHCRYRWTTAEIAMKRLDALERVEKAVLAAAGDLQPEG